MPKDSQVDSKKARKEKTRISRQTKRIMATEIRKSNQENAKRRMMTVNNFTKTADILCRQFFCCTIMGFNA